MTRRMLFRLVLMGMTVLALQRAYAGSAVAMERYHGNLATAYGGPMEREEQRALTNARRLYGPDVRIIAASDVKGFGAIAVAWNPSGHGSIIGIALGKRSATEAYTSAIDKCVKAGGVKPQVRWAFWG
jgi:hypothetical protein